MDFTKDEDLKYLIFIVVLCGCVKKHTQKPTEVAPVSSPDAGSIVECLFATQPVIHDSCDRMFTDNGYLCVKCDGIGACLDTQDQVYCVKDDCLTDLRCHVREAAK